MRKILLISVALLTLLVCNASGVYHLSDQLKTHQFVQQPQVMQVAIVTLEAAPVAVNLQVVELLFEAKTRFKSARHTAFAFIDPGRTDNWKGLSLLSRKCEAVDLSDRIPIGQRRETAVNYNTINYSYGLRY